MKTALLGFASGFAANDPGCNQGPVFLRKYPFEMQTVDFYWYEMFYPNIKINDPYASTADICTRVAMASSVLTQKNQKFITIGGDHSCAIGTWSGVAQALKKSKGKLGMIWIDAHMDSHTPSSSESGNIHGMPLATLLGRGDPRLTQILSHDIKLEPQNVCLIGIRSFEPEEEKLLKDLGVRVYYMDEIHHKGLYKVMQEAILQVTADTAAYGISLDLDGIGSEEIEAVGTPVPQGLAVSELLDCFSLFELQPPIACEIAEYNPLKDKNLRTAGILVKLLQGFHKILNSSEIHDSFKELAFKK